MIGTLVCASTGVFAHSVRTVWKAWHGRKRPPGSPRVRSLKYTGLRMYCLYIIIIDMRMFYLYVTDVRHTQTCARTHALSIYILVIGLVRYTHTHRSQT